MDYRSVIESAYNRKSWQGLLYDIFKSKVVFKTNPIEVYANSSLVQSSFLLGIITLTDGKKIAVYEIQLSSSVDIKENRVGIRNLLISDWKSKGCVGAFMFCYRQNESTLRFSYVSEISKIVGGHILTEATDTKRFTYLLGAGHRSRTAISQFEELKESSLTLSDVTKAFSIEALNDRFFNEYRQNYEDIIEYVLGKRVIKKNNNWYECKVCQPNQEILSAFSSFNDPEKAVRDYVKKLMGRIVFLQFLQKKGWLGVPLTKEWGNGDHEFIQHIFTKCSDKENFVDHYLKVLFHDINTRRIGDLASPIFGEGIKIPFLNGGLFEPEEVDKCSFVLPTTLIQKLLSFFDSYNFTIDENAPDDEEFGVDPEMLGRIFESLLEDNKLKGAFYTPKEIVTRLCQDALCNYLQTGFSKDSERRIVELFVKEKDSSKLDISQREIVCRLLQTVKVCDPSVGSGAFLMGMLHEITQCRLQLENLSQLSPSDIKKHIIERNLFGVDVEKGAVDIARLRLWLSLIIDEPFPHTLPNLEFKVIQGNSLMDIYSENSCKTNVDFIIDKVREIYHTDEHTKKIQLKEDIIRECHSYVASCVNNTSLCNFTDLQIPNEKFTLWHVYFKEVFDKGGFDIIVGNPPYVESKNYIEDSPELAEYIKQYYSCCQLGKVDLCIPFIEMGLNLLNKEGTLCYLTQRRFFMSEYGRLLRSYIFHGNYMKKIFEFLETDLFKGKTTYVSEILLQRGNINDSFIYGNTDKVDKKLPRVSLEGLWNFKSSNDIDSLITDLTRKFGTVGDLVNVKVGLQVLWKDAYHIKVEKIHDGLLYGCSKIEDNIVIEKDSCRAIVQNESFPALTHYNCSLYAIFPYDITDGLDIYRIPFSEYKSRYPLAGEYLERNKSLICSKVQTLPQIKKGFDIDEYWHLYTREQNLKTVMPKVVIPMTTVYPKATVITEEGIYCDNSNVNFVSFDDITLMYGFAGIVNSTIFRVLAKKCAIELRGGYSKYNKQYISSVPYPYEKFLSKGPIVQRIGRIAEEIEKLNNFQGNSSADILYNQLNLAVQELYELSDLDVRIINNEYNETSKI